MCSQILLKKFNTTTAGQELTHILCNPNVHHRVHNSTPPVSNLSHINPVPNNPVSLQSISLIFYQLRLLSQSWLSPLPFPTEALCAIPLFPTSATFFTHVILLDLINRKKSRRQQKLRGLSLCCFLLLLLLLRCHYSPVRTFASLMYFNKSVSFLTSYPNFQLCVYYYLFAHNSTICFWSSFQSTSLRITF